MTVTLSNEQMQTLAESVKEMILKESKAVGDFEKVKTVDGSDITIPVVQSDGTVKAFAAGKWMASTQKEMSDALNRLKGITLSLDASTGELVVNY